MKNSLVGSKHLLSLYQQKRLDMNNVTIVKKGSKEDLELMAKVAEFKKALEASRVKDLKARLNLTPTNKN